jgi:hypothetical protein
MEVGSFVGSEIEKRFQIHFLPIPSDKSSANGAAAATGTRLDSARAAGYRY